MIRTYKRKLILTKDQSNRIDSWIGACRTVYNLGMEVKNANYKATGKSIHKFDLFNQVTELKKYYEWIKDVPACSLQCAVERLDRAYQNFFRTYRNGGGYPKFASKKTYKSIHFKYVSIKKGVVKLPKIGLVKTFKDQEILGIPKTACIIKEATGYFVCIQCEDVPKKFDSENQTIGLDMGISHFCVDSDGCFIANPLHFKKYEDRLRIANKSLARKKKGSNSWKKQAAQLAKLHHTIANVRKDFLHKESTKIAKANNVVVMEDLKVSNMAKNRNLSKHILDCGWGSFKTMLSYKTKVVLVDPKYTSQMCSNCEAIDKESRLSQSEYCCTSCGHTENADFNAAKNIHRKGIAEDRKREAIACALVLEHHSI